MDLRASRSVNCIKEQLSGSGFIPGVIYNNIQQVIACLPISHKTRNVESICGKPSNDKTVTKIHLFKEYQLIFARRAIRRRKMKTTRNASSPRWQDWFFPPFVGDGRVAQLICLLRASIRPYTSHLLISSITLFIIRQYGRGGKKGSSSSRPLHTAPLCIECCINCREGIATQVPKYQSLPLTTRRAIVMTMKKSRQVASFLVQLLVAPLLLLLLAIRALTMQSS